MQSSVEVLMIMLLCLFILLYFVELVDQFKCVVFCCLMCVLCIVCMLFDFLFDDFVCVDVMICMMCYVWCGEMLFCLGDVFNSIYVVRIGLFKMIVMYCDGDEQIIGFQIVGELFGFDGVYIGYYNGDVIVFEDSMVCIIFFGQFEQMCCEVWLMQYYVYQMMSGEIVCEFLQMLLFGIMSVEQCVVVFLLNFFVCFKVCGYLVVEFVLWMMCDEIGEYFGMKFEMVSCMLLKFQYKGFVVVQGKQIWIVDLDGLW